ncbi:phage tail assembly chaperone [Methylobacterium sp. BTF04]|uniref:phage tail assembly chaperone n=1 Tax=Methylobacterium sp. BTF04 TaxID=2708300 RepID=UPI0013D30F1C|nr:phage tail assembly chaperone [Methylobacterium sp. BTF04]NEU14066.1 phage tail assembly chaperone [Methylobacterium sp. BTF04]
MNATGGTAPDAPSAFPWDDALALGLGTLRWRPRDFWAATPRELIAAAGPSTRRSPAAGRADLDRLIAAYPDDA